MKNKEIAGIFFEMGKLLELGDENRFKIRAYTNAAQTVSELAEDVEELVKRNTLKDLPGIGQGLSEKIKEYCSTGKIQEHEKLKNRFPEGLLEMMKLSGLGPKKSRFLYENLKIDSVQKLKEAASRGQLRSLEGFGEKTEENILKGIALHGEFSKRMLLHSARELAQSIVESMKKECRSLENIVPAGSLRRCKETVGDLDFLCVSSRPNEIIESFTRRKEVNRILAKGETKASVILQSGIQCDLRVVEAQSFGAALQYFTGSKEHNVALRETALRKGFTINEYGLFRLDNKNKMAAGKTEEEIYEKLGMEYIPPELRENRGEIQAALQKKIPRLVEEKDIRGDFHNHTHLSDGANSLEEMAQKAREKGWEWFVSADHSQSLKVARGLSPEALLKKKEEIRKLNRKWSDFTLMLGSEVDILTDGKMDYDSNTLKEIDFVVGSVHTGFSQDEEKITGRIIKALENPEVHIIGHLTGRLLGSREAYSVNIQKVLDKALETETAIEINGQPQRLDLYDVHAKSAHEMGVPLVLTTDAHSVHQLDNMALAVLTARRAWLTKKNVLNCLSYEELLEWKRG